MSLFNGNPVSVTKGVHIMPMEEQIVQVKPWNEIQAEKADTVRLEPSGISVAGVEYAYQLHESKLVGQSSKSHGTCHLS